MNIVSLKPNLTRAAAAQMLGTTWRARRRGTLQAVLDFYIPYRLYRVETAGANLPARFYLAVDAVTGRLDPYRFEEAPDEAMQVRVETERSAAAAIDDERAEAEIAERVLRMAFLGGLFRLRDYECAAEPVSDFHVPYWVGIFARGERVELEVIDAVRGQMEGAKVREIIADWFRMRSSRKP